MSHPLAIFTPQIGAFSETFIRRHIERLLPGEVAVVTQTTKKPYAGNWSIDAPLLVLDSLEHSLGRRWFYNAGSRLGMLKTSLQMA